MLCFREPPKGVPDLVSKSIYLGCEQRRAIVRGIERVASVPDRRLPEEYEQKIISSSQNYLRAKAYVLQRNPMYIYPIDARKEFLGVSRTFLTPPMVSR